MSSSFNILEKDSPGTGVSRGNLKILHTVASTSSSRLSFGDDS